MALSNGSKYLTSPSEIPVKASGSETERTLGDWTEGQVFSYATLQDALADGSLNVGDYIQTAGYYEALDGGANRYLCVNAGTGTADGGSFIDHPQGFQMKGAFPDRIKASQFGAVRGSDTSDEAQASENLTALTAAGSYVEAITTEEHPRSLVIDGDYVISGSLTVSGRHTGMQFDGSLIASDSFPMEDYALVADMDIAEINRPKIDGNRRAGGIDVAGGAVQIRFPYITHFQGVAVNLDGRWGGSHVYHAEIYQWTRSDAEFADDANFTGKGIRCDRADCGVIGGSVYWMKECFYLGSGCTTFWVRGCHPFNGRPASDPGGVRVDPVIIHAEDGANSLFHDCYLDNGKINLYSPGHSFKDCSVLLNPNAIDFSDGNFISLFANGQSSPFQFKANFTTTTMSGTLSPIAYLDTDDYSWGGDFDNIHDALSGDSGFQNIDAENRRTVIYSRGDDTVPLTEHLISRPVVRDEYLFSDSQDPLLVYYTKDSMRVSEGNGGTTTINIGGADNGVEVNASGTMTLMAAADRRVEVLAAALRPYLDDAYQLGNFNHRWSEVWSTTGTINTSDEREKTDFEALSEAELSVARKVKALIGKYKWLSSIDEKGDSARWHFGVGAQSVKEAFESEGLDGFEYGCLCFDEWEDEAGVKHDRYGVRASELLFFMMAAL